MTRYRPAAPLPPIAAGTEANADRVISALVPEGNMGPWLKRVVRRWRALVRRDAVERDLDEEVRLQYQIIF